MNDNPQAPENQVKFKARRVAKSVYIVDGVANVGIRVGGMFVVVAVLCMVAFIFSQVLPLFRPPEQGVLEIKAEPVTGRTLLLGCDEYRRTAVRIDEAGNVRVIVVPTGDTLYETKLEAFKDARVSAAASSLRPSGAVAVEGVSDVPEHHIALGSNKGAVWLGKLDYIAGYIRLPLKPTPSDLAKNGLTEAEWEKLGKLEPPEKKALDEPQYMPSLVLAGEGTSRAVIEPLADFRFYRKMRARVDLVRELELPTNGEGILDIASVIAKTDGFKPREVITAVITEKGRVLVRIEEQSINMMTDEIEGEERATLDLTPIIRPPDKPAEYRGVSSATPRFVRVNNERDQLLVGTQEGLLFTFNREADRFTLLPPALDLFAPQRSESWAGFVNRERSGRGLGAGEGAPRLTTMEYLLGDITLLVGDSLGGVQCWMPVKEYDEDVNPRMKRIRAHPPGGGAITSLAPAQTHKSFVAADTSGLVRGIHNTAENVFFEQKVAPGDVVAYAPKKEDGYLAIDGKGVLHHWWIVGHHTDVSLGALFAPVMYESRMAPDYVWQSSPPSVEVEHKYSLMPLITGTLKGGLYALLVAIPLALLGAVYTSEFMNRKLRSVIKPSMEMMASLPSVVLGFLAALYFAPVAAPMMPTIIVAIFVCPAAFMFFGWLWQQLPPSITSRAGTITTTSLLFAILAGAMFLSSLIGPRLEVVLFPSVESADPALLDHKTFKPVNDDAARRLAAGDFRSWTGGGAQLPRMTGVADLAAAPRIESAATKRVIAPEVPLRLAAETTARTEFGKEVVLKPGTRLQFQNRVFFDMEDRRIVDLPEGVAALHREDKVLLYDGSPRILPKGWWNPGGHTLFAALMFFPLTLLAAWVIKVFFSGGGFFGRSIPPLNPLRHVIDPPVLLEKLRRGLAGTADRGLRPVAADVVLSVVVAGGACGVGLALTALCSPVIESLFFTVPHPTAGHVADFRRFITGPDGWKYTQTNSLVVGFAMGFAVIPIIYSIAEDALSTVPNHLRAASLACGASRWQTATRIVIPAAASGIFSAVVIGLGRAVGETMIVVMAAGGTAVMDMQPLVGFRSLAAAIAIEMLEAPMGSTHYRTLFLGGLVLFLMTFVMSTLAEVVRMRLRKKLNRM